MKDKIEYHGKSDEQNRCSFTLFWEEEKMAKDGTYYMGRRGQVFFADPREYGFPRPEEAKPEVEKIRRGK